MSSHREPIRSRALPETWKTRDGRVLLIRQMSDMHIHNTLAFLRSRGKVSLRDWQDQRPQFPTGLQGEYAIEAAEGEFYRAMDEWAKLRYHPAIDAFHLELTYRRRHGITVAEPPQAAIAEQVDPTPSTNEQGTAAHAAVLDLGHVLADKPTDEPRWREADGMPRLGDVVANSFETDYDEMPVVESLCHKAGVLTSVVLRRTEGKRKRTNTAYYSASAFYQVFRLVSRR